MVIQGVLSKVFSKKRKIRRRCDENILREMKIIFRHYRRQQWLLNERLIGAGSPALRWDDYPEYPSKISCLLKQSIV